MEWEELPSIGVPSVLLGGVLNGDGSAGGVLAVSETGGFTGLGSKLGLPARFMGGGLELVTSAGLG